eukprot:5540291-Pleurochrysis_carterae.AAC.2
MKPTVSTKSTAFTPGRCPTRVHVSSDANSASCARSLASKKRTAGIGEAHARFGRVRKADFFHKIEKLTIWLNLGSSSYKKTNTSVKASCDT